MRIIFGLNKIKVFLNEYSNYCNLDVIASAQSSTQINVAGEECSQLSKSRLEKGIQFKDIMGSVFNLSDFESDN
jgi:hypothetical protein